jgi:hypothetical protein
LHENLAGVPAGIKWVVKSLTQLLEGILSHAGVADVELLSQLAADLLRGVQQLVEMALARRRKDPPGAEEEDEAFELALFVGEGVGVEPLVGVVYWSDPLW